MGHLDQYAALMLLLWRFQGFAVLILVDILMHSTHDAGNNESKALP